MDIALSDELQEQTKQLLKIYYNKDKKDLDGFMKDLSRYDSTNAQNMFYYAKTFFDRKDINIFNYISTIPIGFFQSDSNLTMLSSKTPLTIERNAFNESQLTNILKANIDSIGDNAFQNCKNLSRVFLNECENLTQIGNQAFRGCEKLQSIEIPEGVLSIGDGAFRDCKNLKIVKLPKSISKIGMNAFKGCDELLQIIIQAPIKGVVGDEINFYKGHLTPQELNPQQMLVFRQLARKKYGED